MDVHKRPQSVTESEEMHQTPSHFVQSQVIPNSSLVLRNEPGQAESSTGFSSRKDTADSDAGYGLHAHEQETNPTSGLHDDFDPKEFGADSPLMGLDAMSQDADDAALSRDPKKAPASDEAEWGSLSLQSRTTGVSSGSDDSKKELPRPSTMSKIQEMGSHFVEPRRSQTAPMYPQYQPRSEDEAEMIRPRTDQASAAISAFESNQPPQPSTLEVPYQLSVDPSSMSAGDLEEELSVGNGRARSKAYMTAYVVMVVFIVLSFGLYGPKYLK